MKWSFLEVFGYFPVMESITINTQRKSAIWFIAVGVILSIAAIALFFYEKNNDLSIWLQLVLGPLWIAQGIYQLQYTRTTLSWNDEELHIKFPGRKKLVYTDETIKNLTLTQKYFILNAGLSNGEMIDLKYFTETDREKINERFADQTKNIQLI
ncbi:MAG: hypothetical protein WA951_10335 [Leeuwenhoekiella sp.]